jgi:hypothetical protein
MSTKNKLVILELAGIFGWGWLVALGASAVSKSLTRGFEDNKQRVAFEANMIAKGASHEEAGAAWVEGQKRNTEMTEN